MTSLSSGHSGWLGSYAEIAADVSKDGADRSAADHRVKPGGMLGGDLLGRGQGREMRIVGVTGRCGVRGAARWTRGPRRSRPGRLVQTVGVADKPFFKCASAVQPLSDAGEDERDVARAELARTGGGVALERGGEFAAVVDEVADEGEEAPDAADAGRLG
jgi:hypothetical protein